MKVLIADDDLFVRKCLIQMLPWQMLDVSQVLEASNGADALEIALAERPEVVITDIKMPRMNGMELAGCLKDKLMDTCVILVSEYSEFSYAKQALQYGVDDYILKPLVQEKLDEIGEKIHLKLDEIEKRKYYTDLRANDTAIHKMISDALTGQDEQIFSDSLAFLLTQKIHRSDVKSFGMLCLTVLFDRTRKLVAAGNRVDALQKELMAGFGALRSTEEIQAYIVDAFRQCLQLCSRETETASHTKRMKEYIDENYMDPDMSVALVSEYMHLSPIYTGMLFKNDTGQSIVSYIHKVRITQAKKLLLEDKYSIQEISKKVGYLVPDYFTRLFSKQTGMTPSKYKRTVLSEKDT